MGKKISKKPTNVTVAIIGAKGQLGRELMKVFGSCGYQPAITADLEP